MVAAGLLTSDEAAPTARILDFMLAGALRFLLSIELLAEYRDVLLRPKIAGAHGLSAGEVDRLLATLACHAVVRELGLLPAEHAPRSDEHVVALLAYDPRAILITGDRALAHQIGARAVTPREFLMQVPDGT